MPTRKDLFPFVLRELRYGACQEDLSDALNECVRRSQDTGKVSTLTLTVKVKPNGSTGQYALADDIRTKLPSLDKGETLMFGTPEGNLQRTDPRQPDLTDFEKAKDDRPAEYKQA